MSPSAATFSRPDLSIEVNREVMQAGKSLLAAGNALCVEFCYSTGRLSPVQKFNSMRSWTAFLPSLNAMLNLAALFWFYRLVTTTDVTLLGFGLPASATPLVGLWIVAGLCTLTSISAQIKTRTTLSVTSTIASVALQAFVWMIR